MKRPIRFLSPQLPLLAAALVMSFIWDLGYGPSSLESTICLIAALGAGILLNVISASAPRLHAVFIILLFSWMLDIFFLGESWLGALASCTGLLLVLVFKETFPSNVFLICAVVFSLTIFMQAPAPYQENKFILPTSAPGETQFIVHLMLDELGAFDSIPAKYRNPHEQDEITKAYVTRGFHIYNDAHSLSPNTEESLGLMLDTSFISNTNKNVEWIRDTDSFRVRSNTLHARIRNSGWSVSILQSWYVDYCLPRSTCVTYSADSTPKTFVSALGVTQRLDVLKRQAITALTSWNRGLWLFDLLPLRIDGDPISKRGWRSPSIPFVALRNLDLLQDALIRGNGHQYVFAHVLAPHFPWVFASNCSVKPARDWHVPYHVDGRRDEMPDAGAEIFEAYWEQSICVHRKVIALIDAVDAAHPGRAHFIIHGDHGPRILIRYIPSRGIGVLDEQTRRNLLAPFVATRLKEANRPEDMPPDTVLQTLIPAMVLSEIDRGNGQLATASRVN